MAEQIRHSRFECGEIFFAELAFRKSAVHLQRADSRHDHDRRRTKPRKAAFDIEKLLRAEVGAEARLRDGVITERHCRLRRGHAVAAVRDVGERTAVDESGRPLESLNEIRFYRVAQERRHRALRVQIACGDGALVVCVSDYDAGKPLFEIGYVGGEAEKRHYLRSHGDVVAVLPRRAVDTSAEPVNDVPELPVVHVDAAAPCDAARVDAERVPLIYVIVEHGGEKIVRRAYRVKIPGEMKVDVLHGDDLSVSAAGGAALYAEYRTERRLAQRDNGLLPDSAERVRKTDRRRGLAFARRGRRYRGNKHELPLLLSFERTEKLRRDLGFVRAVQLEIFLGYSGAFGDLCYRLGFCRLSDFDIGHVFLRILIELLISLYQKSRAFSIRRGQNKKIENFSEKFAFRCNLCEFLSCIIVKEAIRHNFVPHFRRKKSVRRPQNGNGWCGADAVLH